MKRLLKPFILIFILAWTANIASCAVQGEYQGVVGNLCVDAETGANINCYDALPTGGFPIVYAWDQGYTSVVGSLSIVEDKFVAKLIWANFSIYFLLFSVFYFGWHKFQLTQSRNGKSL